jgi:predicted nucleic acid-binding protein
MAVDDATVDVAWSVQDRCSMSFWDALIVAAAQVQGCAFVLSEDMQHEQRIDSVQIINPFLVGPELLDRPA